MGNPNRLIHEKSPYLLQHANNPVNWYPWGPDAFEKAKQENKLVFLSIGYSTCHWCHVMARESFEDEEVADLLAADYVAVKVDREERPDIDHIYMTVCQMMTGQGGWPLTVVLTPDKSPIFAGTYFPKRDKWGRTGLMEILKEIAAKWEEDEEEVVATGKKIAEVTAHHAQAGESGDIDTNLPHQAFKQFTAQFDTTYGGFGSAPKFPSPHNLIFLLRYYRHTGETQALKMAEKTLDAMYEGGLYDHIGFGFARYATDEQWLVPHFEKMLYDNALLAYSYLEAYQATGQSRYAEIAEHIFIYVLRDMTDDEGGFYSAEDADSEGVEGKFYVWTPEEVREVLGPETGALINDYYGINEAGNFEGKSIPNLIGQSFAGFADEKGLSEADWLDTLQEARERLFQARESRAHPHKDDKILTSWNGLMIAALAKGAKVLHKPAYTAAATKAARFLLTKVTRKDGRLLARYRDGEAAYPAYLDDYAFFAWGLHELYEATWDPSFLEQALQLTKQMLDLFWDEQQGGLFFTGDDSEDLLMRPKEIFDGALPSGNSVAAYNLLRLAHLTDDPTLTEKAEAQLQAFAGHVRKAPMGSAFFLTAVQLATGPMNMIVIAGKPNDTSTTTLLQTVQQAYAPGALLVFHPESAKAAAIETLAPSIREQRMVEDQATAYICENYACQAPLTDPDAVKAQLS